MKPPRLATTPQEPTVDEFADMSVEWRQDRSRRNLLICDSLSRAILNLERETRKKDITKLEKSKLGMTMAKLAEAHSKMEEQARKLGAVKVPTENKEPIGNKPPRTPIQFPTVVATPPAAS